MVAQVSGKALQVPRRVRQLQHPGREPLGHGETPVPGCWPVVSVRGQDGELLGDEEVEVKTSNLEPGYKVVGERGQRCG